MNPYKPTVRKNINVYFVVLPKVHLMDLAGPVQVFFTSNDKNIQFNIKYLGLESSVTSAQGLEISNLSKFPDHVEEDALIVVPGISVTHTNLNETYIQRFTKWLRDVYTPSQTHCYICSGAVLAAKAGMLKNKNCTTHHSILNLLQQLEPKARIKAERIFVKDGNIYTCAGITAGVDLSLHLIAEICGYQTVLKTAREMVIYFRRSGRDPQLSFWLQHRNHVHPVVHKIQDIITQEPEKMLSIARLASEVHMSIRNLGRVFKNATGLSIGQFQQKVRIFLASELITNSHLNIEEIATQVGFSSSDRFRTAWKNWFDRAPSSFRSQIK